MFSHDKPINKISQDILGRGNFAKKLTEAIVKADSSESLVIALNGDWGSGKTSVVNMVKDECINSYEDKIKIVNFNPWYYTDKQNLILKFFEIIATNEEIFENTKKRKKIFDKISEYAANFESIPYLSYGIKPLRKISDTIKRSYENKLTIEAQLNEIKKIFSNLKYKLLIVIDDIDRLTENEIRDIFQLVKLVGDIPNIIYFLSFDKYVVRLALDKIHGGKGEDYIEKIVQVQFELPKLSQNDYDKYLFKRIDEIIGDVPESDFDRDRWVKIYFNGFRFIFRTLRNINTYINALRFDFQLIKGEVNIVDLLGITAIKVFKPSLYDLIRNKKSMFLKLTSKSSDINAMLLDKDNEKYKNEFNLLIKNLELENAYKNILISLFPRTYLAIGDGFYYNIEENESINRKKQRICSEDCFEIYFMFRIPIGYITNNEMKIVMDDDDINTFKQKLTNLNKENKINDFLGRLEDYTKEIPLEKISKYILAFMSIGDTFEDNYHNNFFVDYFYRNSARIKRITYQLLIRIENKEERFEILKEAFNQENISLGTVVNEITHNDYQHGRFNRNNQKVLDKDLLITEENLDELEQIGKALIEKASKNGKLLLNKEFLSILYRWEEWGGKEELKNFISENCISIEKISYLLIKFLKFVSVQNGEGHETSHHYSLEYEIAKKFLDVDYIYSVLKKANEAQLKNFIFEQKEAIRLFKEYYEGKMDFRN